MHNSLCFIDNTEGVWRNHTRCAFVAALGWNKKSGEWLVFFSQSETSSVCKSVTLLNVQSLVKLIYSNITSFYVFFSVFPTCFPYLVKSNVK